MAIGACEQFTGTMTGALESLPYLPVITYHKNHGNTEISSYPSVLIPNFKVKWGKDSSIHCAHRSEWTTGPIITL